MNIYLGLKKLFSYKKNPVLICTKLHTVDDLVRQTVDDLEKAVKLC